MDISEDTISSGDIRARIETSRFGFFTFQVGVDRQAAAMLLQRIADEEA